MPRLGSGFSVAVAQKYTKEDQEQCGGVKSKSGLVVKRLYCIN